jgi:hypothetical protein
VLAKRSIVQLDSEFQKYGKCPLFIPIIVNSCIAFGATGNILVSLLRQATHVLLLVDYRDARSFVGMPLDRPALNTQ